MKETVSRMKDAHKAICQYSTEENKMRYINLKNKAKNSFKSKEGDG